MIQTQFLIWLLLFSVCQASPVISEFMASNQSGLQDADGDFPDWVEIHNPDPSPVDLNGWYLTDNALQLTKWEFPATVIPSGGYLVVFASGKNRAVSGSPLHTNFSLSAGGEYLGLIMPDGVSVVSAFDPKFPAQSEDISYGIPSNVTQSTLLPADSTGKWVVPTNSTNPATTWRDRIFDDSSWNTATMGIGYDTNTSAVNYLPEIGANGNTQAAMYNISGKTSCYVRIPFTCADPSKVLSLKLRVKYDDGFAVYLNGQPLLSGGAALTRNAPASLAWNSNASADHADLSSIVYEEFNVTQSIGQLVAGTNVLAFQSLNRSSGSSDLLLKAELLGDLVIAGAPSSAGYFSTATPGARNGGPDTLVIPQVVTFSAAEGTFVNNFNLTLGGAAAGQVIRYTTNGSVPTAASTTYSTPIAITASTLIRARVFDSVTGASGTVGGMSYQKMGTTLASYGTTGVPFRSALPILVMDDQGIGEIPNDNNYRDVRMHFFDRDGTGYSTLGALPSLSSFAGAKIRGSSSASFDKKSYGIELRRESLDSRSLALLGMPADSDWALISCDDFDPSFMRNAWVYEAFRRIGRWSPRTRFVEVFFNQDGNNLDYTDYRGVYVLCETIRDRPSRVDISDLDASDVVQPGLSGGYILKVDRYDADEYQWHTTRSLPPSTTSGNAVVIHRPKLADLQTSQSTYLRNYFQTFEDTLFTEASTGFTTRNYRNYIDSASWVDHNLFNAFPKNVDALRLSSYFFKDRGRKIEGGPLWDFDRSANSTDGRDDVYTTWAGTGDATDYFTFAWWQPLFQDIEFRQLFVDRWQEHRRGTISTTGIQGILDGFLSEFKITDTDNPAARDYAKWYAGQGKNIQTEVNNLKTWLTNRAAWIDAQFTTPPTVLTPPGILTAGQTVSLSVPAGTTAYYRLDGLDPRMEGGGVRSGSSVYSGAITLGSSKLLIARTWKSGSFSTPGTNWSGPVKALYLINENYAASSNLRVTAVHYNPLGSVASETAALPDVSTSDFEWIELGNPSAGPVNLEGVSLVAGCPVSAVTLPAFSLAPGERAVVVKRRDAFLLRYPNSASRIVAEWTGDKSIDNGGDEVRVKDRSGNDIAWFSFSDSGSWPSRADGGGSALQYIGPSGTTLDYQTGGNWRSSAEVGGTPGSSGSGPRDRVRINEILSASIWPQVDAIELTNPGTTPVDLGGWFLCNTHAAVSADDYRKFRIPNGTTLQPGGHLVFTEQDFNPNGLWNPSAGNAADWEFTLDGPRGGEVWLISANPATAELDAFEDHVEFTPMVAGVSLGRPLDLGETLRPLVGQTLFDANSTALPRAALGAVNSSARPGDVQVSEIMYSPQSGAQEYIEIVNTTAAAVSLTDWTLRGDVDYDFGPAQTLSPGECVLMVGFDPVAAPATATLFRAIYQIPEGIRLFGPWSSGDTLGDGAGDVRLRRKVLPPPDEPTFVGRMIEDEVGYTAFAPWPAGASGTGASIQRLGVRLDGNDPLSWIASNASAGSEAGGIQGWMRANFPSGGSLSGPTADPDGDGLPNRIEYLLGSDPGSPDGSPWSSITRSSVTDDMLFEYRRRRDRDDLALVPRQSTDLTLWSNAVNDEHVGYDGLFEIRRVRIPAGLPKGFVRLEAPDSN